MKLTFWNVNSPNTRLPHVLQWRSEHQVDVLVLQELKLNQDKFPLSAIEEADCQAAWLAQNTDKQ